MAYYRYTCTCTAMHLHITCNVCICMFICMYTASVVWYQGKVSSLGICHWNVQEQCVHWVFSSHWEVLSPIYKVVWAPSPPNKLGNNNIYRPLLAVFMLAGGLYSDILFCVHEVWYMLGRPFCVCVCSAMWWTFVLCLQYLKIICKWN